MSTAAALKQRVIETSSNDLPSLALEVFEYQSAENPIYQAYLKALNRYPLKPKNITEIPFLPIHFFRSHPVLTGSPKPAIAFESSGTTGSVPSKHFVADPDFYRQISQTIFEENYGPLENYHILALLPSYLERQNSSLVFMVDHFIKHAGEESGFYLYELEEMMGKAEALLQDKKKVLIIGVTFALLDLAEKFETDLSGAVVMETGGMKGRRKEMIREEVHKVLQNRLNVNVAHSEYGMTELLSQFYAKERGLFHMPRWARILLRDMYDPFSMHEKPHSGAINVLDLANIDSCCFIETMDIGRKHSGLFSVEGRLQHADIRGCNLMLA